MTKHSPLLKSLGLLLIGCAFGVGATLTAILLIVPQTEIPGGHLSTKNSSPDDPQEDMAVDVGSPNNPSQVGTSNELTIEDPSSAWSAIVKDDIDDVTQRESLIRIANAWIEQDGLSALAEIIVETDHDWEERNQVLGTVIRLVASDDPRSAFEEAAKVPPDKGGAYILSVVVKVWIGTDPIAAMNAINSIESRNVRRILQSTALEIWIKRDPQGVLSNLGVIPKGLQAESRVQAIVALRSSAPEEAMKLFSETTEDEGRHFLANELVGEWVRQDIDAALNWVLFDPDIEDMRNRLMGRVIHYMAIDDPYRAMQVALENPKLEKLPGELDLDAIVISQVASEDLDKALEMVPMVKENSRLGAYTAIGSRLAIDSEFKDAIELAQHLTGDSQVQYYKSVVGVWAQSDPKGLLDSIGALPSQQAKSKAAVALLGRDWFRGILTEKQRTHVKSFLSEEDAVEVEETYPDSTRRSTKPG